MYSDPIEERIAYAAKMTAPLFEANGWKYGGWGTPSEVPTEDRLVETITRLVDGLGDDAWSLSGGRFHVYRLMDEDGEWGPVNISLELLDLKV